MRGLGRELGRVLLAVLVVGALVLLCALIVVAATDLTFNEFDGERHHHKREVIRTT